MVHGTRWAGSLDLSGDVVGWGLSSEGRLPLEVLIMWYRDGVMEC